MSPYLIAFTIFGALLSALEVAAKGIRISLAHCFLWTVAVLWTLQLAYDLGRVV